MRSPHPLNILCLDDEPANLAAYGHIAQAHGHTLSRAGDAQQACALLKSSAFDVVLVDADQPPGDLQALGRRLRMNPGLNRDLRMIAITADPAPADQRFYLDHGFDAWLRKPVEVRTFLETLARRPTLEDRMRRRDVVREWVREEVESGRRQIG